MKVIETVAGMERERKSLRPGRTGLVPTMGYLHEGHLSLVRRARSECEHVIVSIFVNPTQFAPHEDLQQYPRDVERDLALLDRVRVDVVFAPTVEEIYPPGFEDWVEIHGPLTERLEGAARPGHFRGVTTVVARLFRIVRPDRAYFGQKDAQQLRVIRRMATDLGLPVQVVACPTVREPDGLAMSSRNVYLSPEERRAAVAISRSLRLARQAVEQDGARSVEALRTLVGKELSSQTPLKLEYVSVSDEQTLTELDVLDRPALLLVAARADRARLIDNTLLAPPELPLSEDLQVLLQDGLAPS
jgi:pantoate--beta-alanine ligase